MKGPGDKCAVMCRNIQRAGIRRCLQLAKLRGRPDPAKDIAIIRRAALIGYTEAGRLFGLSQSGVKSIVTRYNGFALEILAESVAPTNATNPSV